MKISLSHVEFALQLLGRIALPEERVRKIVLSSGKGKAGAQKYLRAYNLADGNHSLSQIAKACGIDLGNFSRTVDRWTKSGIVFGESSGKNLILRHVYPIDGNSTGK